jgi:hypothetical protein
LHKKEKVITTVVMTLNLLHIYFFALTLTSFDFDILKFWLTMILAGQKLKANQTGPKPQWSAPNHHPKYSACHHCSVATLVARWIVM